MQPLVRLTFLVVVSLFWLVGLLWALSLSAQATTLAVVNNNDSGAGSLRQALLNANISDTITFDSMAFPAGTPATIALLSPLPEIITAGLTIDASGAGVILDGSSAGATDGLLIDAGNVTIRSLQIVNFEKDGVDVDPGSENTTIEGNVISGNAQHGICVQGSNISGTRILDNFLSTNVTGTAASGRWISTT